MSVDGAESTRLFCYRCEGNPSVICKLRLITRDEMEELDGIEIAVMVSGYL